jgi:serine/threonine-protein kinase
MREKLPRFDATRSAGLPIELDLLHLGLLEHFEEPAPYRGADAGARARSGPGEACYPRPVGNQSEEELRAARAEGVVASAEADALQADAVAAGKSPLELLRERGRISEHTLVSLKRSAASSDPGARGPEPLPAMALSDTAAGAPTASTPLDLDDLLGDGDAAPRAASVPRPPTPAGALSGLSGFPVGWERYQPIRLLGQGGMGKVFLARDAQLHREVAIKLVRSDDQVYSERLISEARAQARVDHERVCKVYEVGEEQGEVYIAMQYIAGGTLGAMAKELTVEQKAMLVRDAALGVHEAHHAGIIHRDLKPGNILVERAADGQLKAYVADFGLARSFAEGEDEKTGSVLGTPHYMSPEQARGEVQRLDRRADVYSLGATLYSLLTGAPAMPGKNAMEVLYSIANTEPRPLRALDKDLPVELEAITLRCLEKDRSARYSSARALAEDLDRFLRGDPVEARPTGVWYRLRKRILKHRRLAAAGAVAVALLLSALGWGLSVRRAAAERARLAQRFTESVERIESQARYSALSRLHDIRADRAGLRARMGELEKEIRSAGSAAVGPGSYALGRGYLALGEDEQARAALEAAWASGYREPRVAYALALVMGHLYAERLREVERVLQKDQREKQRREVEQRFRDPALAFLKQSEGAEVPSKEYVAALVAFYEGRNDDALQHLDAVGAGLPWFYEAPALRGEVLVARALRQRDRGGVEAARTDLEAGRRAFAVAIAAAESVPAVHQGLAELEYTAMVAQLFDTGLVEAPFERGLTATRNALAVQADHQPSLLLEARLYRRMAEHKSNQGAEVDGLLSRAVADVERAVAAPGSAAAAREELARTWRQWGESRKQKSQDPGEQLRRAVAVSEEIPPADRGDVYYSNLGLVFKIWADYQDEAGQDSAPNRSKAIDAYTRSLQLNDQRWDTWINLASNYLARGSQPRAKDPERDLAESLAALGKVLALNPKQFVACFYRGEIHVKLAQRVRARGGDPGPELAQALAAYQEGLAINPRVPVLHNGLGRALLAQAREAWDRGEAPGLLLEKALAAFAQAVSVAPQHGIAYCLSGEALALRATFREARGEDPLTDLAAAAAAVRQALEHNPENPSIHADLAMVWSTQASHELARGRDPRPSLQRADEAIQAALQRSPDDPDARFTLAETLGAGALYARRGNPQAGGYDEVAAAYERALTLDPDSLERKVAFGRFCRAWAAADGTTGKGAVPPALTRGLALAEGVLAARPSWPDALVLHADLLLVQARRAERPEARRALAGQSTATFRRAFALNRNLEQASRSAAAAAQALAQE